MLQTVDLGTDFGERTPEVEEIENGWKIYSNSNNEISFIVDVDTENFSSLYVKRKFTSKERSVTDCLYLNPEELNWYGGPEQMDQRYPVQKFDFFVDYAYITKELHSAAIMERIGSRRMDFSFLSITMRRCLSIKTQTILTTSALP